jgi:hypothetical protein
MIMDDLMRRIRAALDPEEPDYAAAAAQLGPEAIPYLEALVQGEDPMLASKAVYLASLIEHERTPQVLEQAAQHSNPAVRVAAAAAAQNLTAAAASNVLVHLVGDDDPGVRKVAQAAVPFQASEALTERLRELPPEAREYGAAAPAGLSAVESMLGESGSFSLMPGESSGHMPGETGGRMPGENQGRMPGEVG